MIRIMGLMGLFMVLVQIHRSAGAVLASELGDSHGFGATEIAGVVGALFLASAVVQLPAGLLFDRLGARLTLTVLGALGVIGIVVFAVAESAAGLGAGRFLIGVGHGGVIAGIFMLAAAWAAPGREATVTATVVALAGGIGGVLATTPLVLALRDIGHDRTFAAVALATALVTAAVYVVVRDAPDAAAGRTLRGESLGQSIRGLVEVMRDRRLRPVFVMGTCFTAPFMTIGGLWSGPYLRDVHRMTKEDASLVLMAMVAVFHVGTLAYGPMDRVLGTRKWVVAGGAASMIALCAMLAAWPGIPLGAAIALLIAFGFFAPFYSVLAAHSRAFVPVHRIGRTIACVNLAGLTMVFAVQSATGWLIERVASSGVDIEIGYRAVFATVALILLVAVSVYVRAEDAPPQTTDQGL